MSPEARELLLFILNRPMLVESLRKNIARLKGRSAAKRVLETVTDAALKYDFEFGEPDSGEIFSCGTILETAVALHKELGS